MTVPHWSPFGTGPLTWRITDLPADALQLRSAWPDSLPTGGFAALGGGAGVRVCVVDSGVAPDHPQVGPLAAAYTVATGPATDPAVGPVTGPPRPPGSPAPPRIEPDTLGDTCGHGTACAGIIRAMAPDCELTSLRVLGSNLSGTGDALIAGLRWAVEQRFDIITMSLSTPKRDFALRLHDLADRAYFGGSLVVASAHNMRIESYPWRFSSVLSVGSHSVADPWHLVCNPEPPVEFFAWGVDVPVAWPDGGTRKCTGNSFATPHVAGICARILSSYPGLAPFQVKNLLHLGSANVRSHA